MLLVDHLNFDTAVQAQNMIIHTLAKASEPGTPAEGQVYTDITNHILNFHNGTAFRNLAMGPTAAVTDGHAAVFDGTTGAYLKSGGAAPATLPIALTDLASWADGSIIIGGAADWEALAAGSQSYVLTMGASRPEWSSPGAPSAHDLLGTSHSDTATATVSRGSLIYGNTTPAWDELVISATSTHVLRTDGTDVYWGASPPPTGAALTRTDDTNVTLTLGGTPATSLLQATSLTLGWTGTLADGRITSATTWNNKQDGHANLTSLAGLTYVSTSFVKMTGANTFSLDTNTYLTSETSHSDVLVDGDFTSQGIMLRGASTGVYSIATNSSAITGIQDGTLTESSTLIPTSNSVFDAIAVAVTSGMTYKGGYNASTNTPDLDTSPSGVEIGDTYHVTVAGTFFTEAVQVGDMLVARIDNAATLADWTIVQNNIPSEFTFLTLDDVDDSTYTGKAGYIAMVNSTPDAMELVDPSLYNLSNFNDDLSYGDPYTPAALTRTDDTNVTLTLGGTPATALLQATSLTLGWTGDLSVARGGTGQSSFTQYGVLYAPTTTSIGSVAAATTGTFLRGSSAANPAWSTLVLPNAASAGQIMRASGSNVVAMTTATYPATATVTGSFLRISSSNVIGASTLTLPNTATQYGILYASTANNMVVMATTADSVLITNSSGVPSWDTLTGADHLTRMVSAALGDGDGEYTWNHSLGLATDTDVQVQCWGVNVSTDIQVYPTVTIVDGNNIKFNFGFNVTAGDYKAVLIY